VETGRYVETVYTKASFAAGTTRKKPFLLKAIGAKHRFKFVALSSVMVTADG
jgi:hypothetical protein